MLNSRIAAALHYARLGYAVFPCIPKGKRPLTKEGLHAASSCPEQIEAWWQRWSSANLAVLPPADVLVLDFDDKTVANCWLATYPELNRAPRTRTPRGGLHIWLKVPEYADPASLKTRVKAAEGEVDLRGLGRAYLIVPPSQTPAGTYRWEQGLVVPDNLSYADNVLLETLTPPQETFEVEARHVLPIKEGGKARRYALAALESEHTLVAATVEGTRNDRLNRAAYALGGYVAHELLTFEEVANTLLAAARACGLPEAEAVRTIKSGLEAGYQSPRSLPKHLRLQHV